MSNDSFAAHLGIGVRTVAEWRKLPHRRPRPEMQQLLDTALAQADQQTRDRFALYLGGQPARPEAPQASAPDAGVRATAEHRLIADESIGQALTRLDHFAGWEPGTARGEVATRITQLDRRDLLDRADRRSRIGQASQRNGTGDVARGPADGDGNVQGDEIASGSGDAPRRGVRAVSRLTMQGAQEVQTGAGSLQYNIFPVLLERERSRERPALDGSPYRWLSAFRAEDAAVFSGRDRAAGQVLARTAGCLEHPALPG